MMVVSVYMCVCLFVCPRSYLQNYTSDLQHGSILLWQLSDTLRVSSYVDDVVFAHKLIGCSTSPSG